MTDPNNNNNLPQPILVDTEFIDDDSNNDYDRGMSITSSVGAGLNHHSTSNNFHNSDSGHHRQHQPRIAIAGNASTNSNSNNNNVTFQPTFIDVHLDDSENNNNNNNNNRYTYTSDRNSSLTTTNTTTSNSYGSGRTPPSGTANFVRNASGSSRGSLVGMHASFPNRVREDTESTTTSFGMFSGADGGGGGGQEGRDSLQSESFVSSHQSSKPNNAALLNRLRNQNLETPFSGETTEDLTGVTDDDPFPVRSAAALNRGSVETTWSSVSAAGSGPSNTYNQNNTTNKKKNATRTTVRDESMENPLKKPLPFLISPSNSHHLHQILLEEKKRNNNESDVARNNNDGEQQQQQESENNNNNKPNSSSSSSTLTFAEQISTIIQHVPAPSSWTLSDFEVRAAVIGGGALGKVYLCRLKQQQQELLPISIEYFDETHNSQKTETGKDRGEDNVQDQDQVRKKDFEKVQQNLDLLTKCKQFRDAYASLPNPFFAMKIMKKHELIRLRHTTRVVREAKLQQRIACANLRSYYQSFYGLLDQQREKQLQEQQEQEEQVKRKLHEEQLQQKKAETAEARKRRNRNQHQHHHHKISVAEPIEKVDYYQEEEEEEYEEEEEEEEADDNDDLLPKARRISSHLSSGASSSKQGGASKRRSTNTTTGSRSSLGLGRQRHHHQNQNQKTLHPHHHLPAHVLPPALSPRQVKKSANSPLAAGNKQEQQEKPDFSETNARENLPKRTSSSTTSSSQQQQVRTSSNSKTTTTPPRTSSQEKDNNTKQEKQNFSQQQEQQQLQQTQEQFSPFFPITPSAPIDPASSFFVSLFRTFSDEKRVYFILEHAAGGELFARLRSASRFPVEVARFYIAEIIIALDYLHSKEKIVFRDLQPDNILLDAAGHVKICDFGNAKGLSLYDNNTITTSNSNNNNNNVTASTTTTANQASNKNNHKATKFLIDEINVEYQARLQQQQHQAMLNNVNAQLQSAGKVSSYAATVAAALSNANEQMNASSFETTVRTFTICGAPEYTAPEIIAPALKTQQTASPSSPLYGNNSNNNTNNNQNSTFVVAPKPIYELDDNNNNNATLNPTFNSLTPMLTAEQINNQNSSLFQGHSFAVDWWSVGVLLFEMVAGYPPFFDDVPNKIFEKAARASRATIPFPPWFDARTKDLISGLLQPDPTKRLGSLKRGVTDIMKHRFFAGIDWMAMRRKQVPPPEMIRESLIKTSVVPHFVMRRAAAQAPPSSIATNIPPNLLSNKNNAATGSSSLNSSNNNNTKNHNDHPPLHQHPAQREEGSYFTPADIADMFLGLPYDKYPDTDLQQQQGNENNNNNNLGEEGVSASSSSPKTGLKPLTAAQQALFEVFG